MDKRTLLSFVLACIFLTPSYANPIDVTTAKNIAGSFIKSNTTLNQTKVKSSTQATLQLAYTCTDKNLEQSTSSHNYFYVFNREDNNGFILVSGDDRYKAILGYTDSGYFDIDNIPANFQYWLDCYKNELKRLSQLPGDFNLTQQGESSNSNEYKSKVEPLLGKIAFNQDAPYNNLCPDVPDGERSVTGCVATAMAQVMKFHQYPTHGVGQHSYRTTTVKLNLSADFENTTYDWNNTLDTYTPGGYFEEQATAVATLMYHCGVAVDMDYHYIVSNAYDTSIAGALVDYFNYDAATVKYCNRDYYTTDEWKSLIKKELSNDHPVIYNGQSAAGGHSFVCDGYDEDGLFHINWGWGGQSNGYFELNILSPGIEGIGSGYGGYSFRQSAIIGIQPLKGEVQAPKEPDLKFMLMDFNDESISENSSTQFIYIVANHGLEAFTGSIALAIGQDDNYQYISEESNVTIASNRYIPVTLSVKGSSFLEGSYKIYPAYKVKDSDTWNIMQGPCYMAQYVNATTADKTTNFYVEDNQDSEIEISDLKVIDELIEGESGTFEFTVKNKGPEFNQALCIVIGKTIFWAEGVYLQDGESKTVRMTGLVTQSAGKHTAYVAAYSMSLGGIFWSDDNKITITINKNTSGISEQSIATTKIYPNPANNTLYINSEEKVTDIQIFNLSGQTVLSNKPLQSGNIEINLSSLPTGSYMLQVKSNDKIETHKFIKE